MKKSLKKVLCGLMAGLMVAVTVPAALPETAYVTEVQAAARVATPKLVSAKASGKSKIVFKWKAVKGASGYTVFRKEKGGKWKNVAEVKGAKKTAFSDTKVTTGTQYTYSVKAFKTTKGKKTFSSYNKKRSYHDRRTVYVETEQFQNYFEPGQVIYIKSQWYKAYTGLEIK